MQYIRTCVCACLMQQGMKKMFKRCRLVHSDLSPYNILWYNGEAVFIDVGQAVDATHPHSMDFLLRDCTKISDFFSKHFLPEVGSPHELFNDITGLTIQATSDQEFLVKVCKLGAHSDIHRFLGWKLTEIRFMYIYVRMYN